MKQIKINVLDLLVLFDEQMPQTNEELQIYWFTSTRSDGFRVTLAFSVYEQYADIIVSDNSGVTSFGVNMENCSEIRILDEKKKTLEIVHDTSKARCILSLLDDSVLQYQE